MRYYTFTEGGNMILCTINGERRQVAAATTVAALLAEMRLQGRKIAVEKNGVIVPKSRHAAEPVATGDVLEIVGAVGGG